MSKAVWFGGVCKEVCVGIRKIVIGIVFGKGRNSVVVFVSGVVDTFESRERAVTRQRER